MSLNKYTTLGRSGLRVSPLCLGTMTFGADWGWGAEEAISRDMFNRYVEAGGNHIDTADLYTDGHSEELVGKFIAERNLRDRVVVATKFSFNPEPGNPNSGGNGRKNIYRALNASLRRLKTDYIDLYYVHVWDVVTPVEEVLSTLTDLIREGKIRYYGFSDTPAWYAARAQTLAQKEGKEPVTTLQLEYSLVERNIEREHVPATQQLGIGICPWSPLASGLLSGKYKPEGSAGQADGRLAKAGSTPFSRFTLRNWCIVDALVDVAKQINKTPAQVALNWVVTQPGVTSTILGTTKVAQLDDNLGALDFAIPAELRKRLDDVSAPETVHPYTFFTAPFQSMISGGTSIEPWKPAEVYDRSAVEPPVRPGAATAAENK